jgi:hypothetical protein
VTTTLSQKHSIAHRLNQRDDFCHLCRNFTLSIERQRRIINAAACEIARLTEDFELALTNTREQDG